MERGSVIWFDVGKGYGYIRPDGGGTDLLVTLCAVERAEMASLTEGQRLSFESVYDNRTGQTCAENISMVLKPNVCQHRQARVSDGCQETSWRENSISMKSTASSEP